MPSLPNVKELGTDPQLLNTALEILLEAPASVLDYLTPPIFQEGPPTSSYRVVLDSVHSQIKQWPTSSKADFIVGHPRIGEPKSTGMSELSQKEQQVGQEVHPSVLQRLQKSNAEYEKRYPGLRYITFVNGRSKAEIAEELEEKLQGDATPYDAASPEYEAEVERAITAIFAIAHSRLEKLEGA